MKKWKEKIGIVGKYFLTGHSLGGYISSIYAMRYPEEIKKLLLLSPVGLPHKPEDYDKKMLERMDSRTKRIGVKMVHYFWENNYTPFGVLRFTGRFGSSKFLDIYLTRRMKFPQGEEREELKSYLH